MIGSLLKLLLRSFVKDHADVKKRTLLLGSPTVFENVSVVYNKSILGALKFTLRFMLRVILVFGPPILFLFYMDYKEGLYSYSMTISSVHTGVFSFVMLTLIVFSGYFAHRHYGDMSGLGTKYDFKKLIESRFRLYVNEKGLHGVVKLPWKFLKSLERSGTVGVQISLKKHLFIPLPSHTLLLKFLSQEDADEFIRLAGSEV